MKKFSSDDILEELMFRNVNTDMMNYIMDTMSIHSAIVKGLESIYVQQSTLLKKVDSIEKNMTKQKHITVKKIPNNKKDIVNNDLIDC
ncbi:hypothetical protein DB313_05155 (plasmid) [Borrelia turcica IST7]|uniref:Uncharacterized protein n=1 Tax=Borrelia turcica IST7 TaxID=1104446 RepID=A0A386PQ27_9SPIR|nr:hypothetical protein [Borrelia turcica]AYE36887.1 hypothetical protein DB313_05155 [Borrelia turcica IST7]